MIEELSGDFIQRLRGFYYVAKTGSFSAAAREMNRNQSTVSYQVSQLEKSLATTLFQRTGRGATLTPQGRSLFTTVLDIFDKIELLQGQMCTTEKEVSGAVCFAISPLALHSLLIPLLPQLHTRFPAVQFTILQIHEQDNSIFQALNNRTLDFAIAASNSSLANLHFTPFFTSRTVLCAPENMPLTLGNPIKLSKLAKLPHIVSKALAGIRGYVDELMHGHGEMLNVVQVVENMYLQAAMVNSGFGVAFMDEQAVATIRGTMRLKTYALGDIFPDRLYGIVQRPHTEFSAQSRQVIDFFLHSETITQ